MIQWNYVIPAVIVGTMGWMIYLAGMPIMGLVAGAGAGASLGLVLAGMIQGSVAPMLIAGIGAAMGGVLGFWLVRLFQKWLFFAAGASAAGTLGFQMLRMPFMKQYFDVESIAPLIVVALFALFGGILCLQMRRYIMAVITSIIGVFLLVPGLPESWAGPGMIISLVCFLAIQIGLVNRFVDKDAFDRRIADRAKNDRPDV